MLYFVIGSLTLGAVLITLLALASANTGFFAENFPLLLTLTSAAALVLMILFLFQVFTLWRRIKVGVFGARLTARMFWIFGLMAFIPGIVVYGVSVQFLIKSIESWFDVRVEQALESGLSLGQSALEHLELELVRKAEAIAQQLSEMPVARQAERLDQLREATGLQEAALFDEIGRLLGFSSADKSVLVPFQPESAAIWQARLQQPWSRIEAVPGSDSLLVRVVVPVNLVSLTETLRLLQVTQLASGKLTQDAHRVEEAHRDYQELAVSRLGLKRLYGVSLTLALALALFSALALAFLLSERLAAPLRVLARGTRAVARGDYSQVHPVASRDELGMLTQSFNRMTQQLSEARSAAQEGHDKLLEAKAYLESVLGSVNTGVVTLDKCLNVRLVNPAAAAILGIDRALLGGGPLADWGEPESGLRKFAATMSERFLEAGTDPWREQVEFSSSHGPRILLARGTPLMAGEAAEYSLVFDDITQLVQAQRDAAWGEVARRLAHEIKNPLTPIQLSAERLQIKLMDHLDDHAQQILARATDTIVGQVAAMKSLVDAFAQYARLPAPKVQPLKVNDLVADIAALYEGHLPLTVALEDALPVIAADPALLRQVLVNLIKNAQESLADAAAGKIQLRTHRSANGVTICVEDNGPGFPDALMNRLFEPYATSKPKGTGLGLAIVKKIVEEHHGSIEVRNLSPHGASVCLTLAVMEMEHE